MVCQKKIVICQPASGGRKGVLQECFKCLVGFERVSQARDVRNLVLRQAAAADEHTHARRNRSHTHTQRLSQHTTGCTSAWLANPCGAARPLNDTRHPLCGNQQCTDVSLAQRQAVPEVAMRDIKHCDATQAHTHTGYTLKTKRQHNSTPRHSCAKRPIDRER